MMNLGAANEFPRIAKHSDVELLNITKESLDDKKSARFWGHCPFPECKATTLCQLRWKAVQVVLTWFSNNVHDNQELPGSHKNCTKKVADAVAYNFLLRTLLSDHVLPDQDSQLKLQLKKKRYIRCTHD